MYYVDEWIIALVLVIILTIFFELGYFLGFKRFVRKGGKDEDIGAIQGGILGLLGIMFAFTFSMAASRFDSRKIAVLKESNAIGTTYLRVSVLPDSIKPEIYALLEKYVEYRLKYDRTTDRNKMNAIIDSSEIVQLKIWRMASKNAVLNNDWNSSLFLSTLNEMIDLSAERYAVQLNHVPEIILYLMILLATISTFTLGFGCGLEKNRKFIFSYSLVVLMILVLMVIIDLDRPLRGIIRVGDKSLLDLDQSIEKYSPLKAKG
ncbi:hypothetical protein AW09_02287 [Sporocytophaga myxococcoides]|uniref:DUF4239 domain-containing protein n=1 Tax=Sporocytophaga myxococcoides TaxID=153721 RepID=A0A098LL93_9BACT|nr:hypothetical protein AW09_02287 [Sporocytophaga myxococcoides]